MPLVNDRPSTAVYALLDNVRSAWNVGSIFRTADAIRLDGLYLCGMTATPPRPDVEKTALGATLTVPWDFWPDAVAAVRHLKQQGIQVVALEQTPESRPFDEIPWKPPLCFVVGHEVEGVCPQILAEADLVAEIPMSGSKKSLNVAVSFGVLAYEIRRHLPIRPPGNGGHST